MNLRDAKRMVYEQELNYEREKNAKPDDYKYYNPKNFTTNPERIYKIIDEIEKDVVSSSNDKIYLKPRFSPGYGDLDISYQKDFIRLLDTPKKIGLSLTNGGMLAPTKSVTAIIGITNTDFRAKNKCSSCNSSNCEFREN